MSNKCDVIDRRHVFSKCNDDVVYKVKRYEQGYRKMFEYDKKVKREIANSNERRRMQSINMGFENLKQLLPSQIEGEKLSKASILQLTAQYIHTLMDRLSKLEDEISLYKKTSKPDSNFEATISVNKYINSSNPTLKDSNEEDDETIANKSDSSSIYFCDSTINSAEDDLLKSIQSNKIKRSAHRKRKFSSPTIDTNSISKLELNQLDAITIHSDEFKSTQKPLDAADEEISMSDVIYCDDSDPTDTPPGSLEHLVAAIEQVEGQQFYSDGSTIKCHLVDSNNHSPKTTSDVILSMNIDENPSSFSLLKYATISTISSSNNNTINNNNTNATNNNNNTIFTSKVISSITKLNSKSPNLSDSCNTSVSNNNQGFSVIKPTISPFTEKIISEYPQNPKIFQQHSPSLITINHNNCFKRLNSSSSSSSTTVNNSSSLLENNSIINSISNLSETNSSTEQSVNLLNRIVECNVQAYCDNSLNNINNNVSTLSTNLYNNASNCDKDTGRRIPIPHKYLHRPEVVYQKYNSDSRKLFSSINNNSNNSSLTNS